MNEILKLHEYSKDRESKIATQFCHGGKDVIRKLEIAQEIAKEPNVQCLNIAAKNTIVYAAVRTKNTEEEEEIVARIYDTNVYRRNGNVYISWCMYEESDYMSKQTYDETKARLEELKEEGNTMAYDKLMSRLNREQKYVLPTGCHSKILKLLTPTAVRNVNQWRMDCGDKLAMLAAEKNYTDSLTNLPLLSIIKLNKFRDDGTQVYLVKDNEGNFKYPIWIDDTTGQKYKIRDIQEIGYEIKSRE